MKLEEQVCSLELSKKLKELGVKQESLFYWVSSPYISVDLEWTLIYRNEEQRKLYDSHQNSEWISAFTVSELGYMLPDNYYSKKIHNEYDWIFYYYENNNDTRQYFIANTEANVRAKLLIWLIENGYIKEIK